MASLDWPLLYDSIMINLILGLVTLSETLNAPKILCHIILLKKKYLTNLSSALESQDDIVCIFLNFCPKQNCFSFL